MYVVVAEYYTQEGKEAALAAVLERMVPIANAEPGCALYVVNRSREDPRKFLLYEQYLDEASYESHIQSAPVQEHIFGSVVPMLEHRVRHFYDIIGSA